MQKKMKKVISILLATFILTTCIPLVPMFNTVLTVEAHSGRTDGSGGHHDYKNKSGLGSYHYHCGGHPAHLHPNGVCPYSGASAATSSSSKNIQKTAVQDSDVALRAKYKSVTDDFSNKKKSGYFRNDVLAVISQFIAADPNAADAYMLSLMTSEEKTDLLPLNTQAKSDIFDGLIVLRAYEVFLNQVVAREQAQAALQQQMTETPPAALQQENTSQDDLLYKLVSQTQAKLNELGFYTGAIDGIFDNETQQALINFQTAYGLIIDGTINEQVVAALGIQI